MAYDESTDLTRGEDMMLYVDDGTTKHPIAFATSNSISITADTIDTSNKMSGAWKAYITGQSGWTVSTEALVSKVEGHYSYQKLKELMIAREAIEVVFGYVDTSSDEFALDATKPSSKGKAFITSLDLNTERGGICTSSTTLQGTGALTDVAGTP